MKPLDPTQQRVLGVLIEKELSVPESYPLTENSLQAGCNQKSNRDPVTALEVFEISGTLLGLQEEGWVGRTDRDGGRTTRFKHLVEAKLGLDKLQKAVLAELLLRGPQSPTELKNRVGRMGCTLGAEEVGALLGKMADKTGHPLCEQLPRAPRERDVRWAHTLGPRPVQDPDTRVAEEASSVPQAESLPARLAALEARVAALEARLQT